MGEKIPPALTPRRPQLRDRRGRLVHGTVASTAMIVTEFWARVEKTEGCWLWRGKLIRRYGYGIIYLSQGRTERVHRFAWELANNQKVPAGLHVLHSCDVRNSLRLRSVSPSLDHVPHHCRRGHEFTPENTTWWAEQKEVPNLHEPTRAGSTVTIPDGYLTREDVRWLEAEAERAEAPDSPNATLEPWLDDPPPIPTEVKEEWARRAAFCRSLAARIEALLPPSDEKPPA